MATGAIEARYDGHAEFYDRLFAAYTDATDSPGAELTRLLGPPPVTVGSWTCAAVAG
jgi:hypothetical protein